MTGSEVRYVDSGGVNIAYRVFGDGPLDLVLVPAFTSHLEQNLEWPGLVRWVERLASFSRFIVFDKRSTGLSDHAPGPVVLEDTMQDVLAVLDATGAERPVIYGDLEGAALSALFAATHPERPQGDDEIGRTSLDDAVGKVRHPSALDHPRALQVDRSGA